MMIPVVVVVIFCDVRSYGGAQVNCGGEQDLVVFYVYLSIPPAATSSGSYQISSDSRGV
jgi:hypothetical protein